MTKRPSTKRAVHLPLMIAAILLVAGCDQATKGIARARLQGRPPVSILGDVLLLGYVENDGAFLSLGSSLPPVIRYITLALFPLVLIVGFSLYLLRAPSLSFWEKLGGSFIIGGGASNLADRFMHQGRVGDFINAGLGNLRTGIFNVADLAILGGSIAVLVCIAVRRATAD